MSNVIAMPSRCSALNDQRAEHEHTRRMLLRSQATYLVAEQALRANTLNPYAELVDEHPEIRRQYLEGARLLVEASMRW